MAENSRNKPEAAGTRFPCHAWQIADPAEAVRFPATEIKDYGMETRLEDGTKLHVNYTDTDPDGGRSLLRCKACGALVMKQYTMDDWDWEDTELVTMYVPVSSVEEADLLNILEDGFMGSGFRCLYVTDLCNHVRCSWTEGEKPRPLDPEKLRRKIREKYAGLKPAQKKLLEKLISSAGRTERKGGKADG